MNGDQIEAQRRLNMAAEYVKQYPPKRTFNTKKLQTYLTHAYLYGYNQACMDLLSPKDTPGVPATAILLLNRIGEMVLKNRADLLKTPTPRLQCPGCFCLMAEGPDQETGWCDKCVPHKDELILQVSHLLQVPADSTMGVLTAQEYYDAQNPCAHTKGFPCGDCGQEGPDATKT